MAEPFSGSAMFPEVLAGTIRAVFNDSGVGGDTGYWIDAAKRQLAGWSTEAVVVSVEGR